MYILTYKLRIYIHAYTHTHTSILQCNNTRGSFACVCKPGFNTSSGSSCTDINECAVRTLNTCNANAVCTNNEGSFTCRCQAGFSGDGTKCESVSGGLVSPSQCTTFGGYVCAYVSPYNNAYYCQIDSKCSHIVMCIHNNI